MTRVPRTVLGALLVWIASSFFSVSPASAANLTCPSATTLDALATCIRTQMPQSGSN